VFGDEVGDVNSCCPQPSLCSVVKDFDWVLIEIAVWLWGVGCVLWSGVGWGECRAVGSVLAWGLLKGGAFLLEF
jgi:hypothetical protein